MSRYYCPFCSSRYQFYKTKGDGVLICGLCGDPLVKKPFINSKQIFALFAASTFLAPLILMFIFVIKDLTKEKLPRNSESLVFLIVK
tara:strand:- start:311 stop:571 length:261 start_codon:yes stop_codon:yes gene_type:complete